MEHHVAVSFGVEREYGFRIEETEALELTQEQAREWLEQEYASLEPDQTTPVGKSILADKLLTIVRAYGEKPFASGTAWARQFARCTGRAVGRGIVRIDVPAGSVGY